MSVGAVAILSSILALFALAMRDPKRLRTIMNAQSERYSSTPMSATMRRVLTGLVFLPGIVLVCLGDWWAALVWLGSVMAVGWVTARVLALTSD